MSVNRTNNSATAQRRQRQIEDCLFENLQHTSWQSISVADICRQVGISRKAYYNYYKDKNDCFCSYVDRILRDAALYTAQNLPDEATPLEAAVVLLDYWKLQKTFLDVIVRNGLLDVLILRNVEYVLKEDRSQLERLSTESLPSDTDILACYTAVQTALLLCWYSRNFEDPTEEIARKFLRLLHKPLIPGMEE